MYADLSDSTLLIELSSIETNIDAIENATLAYF